MTTFTSFSDFVKAASALTGDLPYGARITSGKRAARFGPSIVELVVRGTRDELASLLMAFGAWAAPVASQALVDVTADGQTFVDWDVEEPLPAPAYETRGSYLHAYVSVNLREQSGEESGVAAEVAVEAVDDSAESAAPASADEAATETVDNLAESAPINPANVLARIMRLFAQAQLGDGVAISARAMRERGRRIRTTTQTDRWSRAAADLDPLGGMIVELATFEADAYGPGSDLDALVDEFATFVEAADGATLGADRLAGRGIAQLSWDNGSPIDGGAFADNVRSIRQTDGTWVNKTAVVIRVQPAA